VPEGNIAQTHAIPTIKKKYLYFLTLAVMPNMMNATPVEAMPIPKLAASLYVEKYLISEPPCNKCVDLPLPYKKELSEGVSPMFFCFQTQYAAKSANAPQINKYFMRMSGFEMYIEKTKKAYMI
jgi:hypothetical protein